MKYRIIEVLFVLMIVLVASLVYVQSNELEYVFKYLSIIPLLLFYDRCFNGVYGDISARQYVGLKCTLIPLSFVLMSIRVSTTPQCNVLLIISVVILLITMFWEFMFYLKTHNVFYRTLIIRQVVLSAVAISCDFILLQIHGCIPIL